MKYLIFRWEQSCPDLPEPEKLFAKLSGRLNLRFVGNPSRFSRWKGPDGRKRSALIRKQTVMAALQYRVPCNPNPSSCIDLRAQTRRTQELAKKS